MYPKKIDQDEIYAWHFSTGEMRFDYEGTQIVSGLVLEAEGKPMPEKNGFHACEDPMDALRYFAIRPNNTKLISRVKLSGEIVEDSMSRRGIRLTATRREHLWLADAQDTLENFALSYLDLVFDWLRKEKIDIPDILFEALDERKQYLQGNSTRQKVHDMTQKLIDFAKEQKNPFEYQPTEYDRYRPDPDAPYKWYMSRTKYSVSAWQEFWKDRAFYFPVELAKGLGIAIRRDTQDFVFTGLWAAYKCRHRLCNYHGWYRAIAEDYAAIGEYIERLREQAESEPWGYPSLLLREGFDAPEPYRKNCKFRVPDPSEELHKRLMQLAPDGYKETD